MTRTAEIRSRMTNETEWNSWIAEMLTRMPLEGGEPEFPAYRFADSVKIPKSRIRRTACELWFDNSPIITEATSYQTSDRPFVVHYKSAAESIDRNHRRRQFANRLLAIWWRITGRGTAGITWVSD